MASMSEHSALYSKYRPQAFAEMLGQEQVTSVLEGSIAKGSISHAYLFSGSRGTGKTSLARIFSRAIGTDARDLYEIDAASNRGVDDIRTLREEVHTLPFNSKYKVYLIDEAHMLTKEAWNALLKTLEEPPKHVVFILATTEHEKVPETILSRCQVFTFKRPTLAVLKQMVTRVAKAEGFTLEPSAADLIALLADGSFRDAHGTLQKIISSSPDKNVSVEEVERVSGAPRTASVLGCITGVAAGDVAAALSAVRDAEQANVDMKVFAKLLLRALRAILLTRAAPAMAPVLSVEFGEAEWTKIEHLASQKNSPVNSHFLGRLLDALPQIGLTYVSGLPIELAILDHLAPKN